MQKINYVLYTLGNKKIWFLLNWIGSINKLPKKREIWSILLFLLIVQLFLELAEWLGCRKNPKKTELFCHQKIEKKKDKNSTKEDSSKLVYKFERYDTKMAENSNQFCIFCWQCNWYGVSSLVRPQKIGKKIRF